MSVSTIPGRLITELHLGLLKLDGIKIPDVSPQWDAPGVDAGKFIAGWLMALGAVGLVALGVISVLALVGSKVLTSGQRTLAVTGVIVCFGGGILLGSITALLNFAGTIKLVG